MATLEHPPGGGGDGARLLGDDDHHRVGVLAHAQGGPVAGAQLGADVLVAGKGQDAAGGVNLALPDNHPPIVDGLLVEKDIGDKLGGGRGLDNGTGGHNLAQLGLALKDNQRAHAQLLEDRVFRLAVCIRRTGMERRYEVEELPW